MRHRGRGCGHYRRRVDAPRSHDGVGGLVCSPVAKLWVASIRIWAWVVSVSSGTSVCLATSLRSQALPWAPRAYSTTLTKSLKNNQLWALQPQISSKTADSPTTRAIAKTTEETRAPRPGSRGPNSQTYRNSKTRTNLETDSRMKPMSRSTTNFLRRLPAFAAGSQEACNGSDRWGRDRAALPRGGVRAWFCQRQGATAFPSSTSDFFRVRDVSAVSRMMMMDASVPGALDGQTTRRDADRDVQCHCRKRFANSPEEEKEEEEEEVPSTQKPPVSKNPLQTPHHLKSSPFPHCGSQPKPPRSNPLIQPPSPTNLAQPEQQRGKRAIFRNHASSVEESLETEPDAAG